MSQITLLLIGFIVSTSTLLLLVYLYVFYGRRPGNGSLVSKHFFEATISRQLVPRLSPLIESGDKLVVVGGDGMYHATIGGPTWLNGLKSWLEKGLKIDYLIVDGSPELSLPLLSLAMEFPDTFVLQFADIVPSMDRKIIADIEAMQYSHPVSLTDSYGQLKAIWFENYHSPESHIARNVDYFAQQDIGKQQKQQRALDFIEKARRVLEAIEPMRPSEIESVLGNVTKAA